MPALDAEDRRRIAQQASDIRWVRAGKHTLPDGSRRKIRLYLKGMSNSRPSASEKLAALGAYPDPDMRVCALCGTSRRSFEFGPHPAICDVGPCVGLRHFGRFRGGERAHRITFGGSDDVGLLRVAYRVVLHLETEGRHRSWDPPPLEGPIMAKPDHTFTPGPLSEHFNLMGLTTDLIRDLQDLRADRISVPKARAIAALAHQALRAAQLVLTAQRYLMDNARALPAPESTEKGEDKPVEAVSIITPPKRGRRRRDG